MTWKFPFVLGLAFAFTAHAEPPDQTGNPSLAVDEESGIEELNPFASNINEYLEGLEGREIGRENDFVFGHLPSTGCYQQSCALYVDIDKASQTLRFYYNGRFEDQWLVSTGAEGFRTPNFNKRFDGRIYDRYTSSKYPGGNYNGLGNMPYAMFISGGIALHGTPRGNWRRLGRAASHGCIRLHPDNAYRLNRLLRQYGVGNSWVTVR